MAIDGTTLFVSEWFANFIAKIDLASADLIQLPVASQIIEFAVAESGWLVASTYDPSHGTVLKPISEADGTDGPGSITISSVHPQYWSQGHKILMSGASYAARYPFDPSTGTIGPAEQQSAGTSSGYDSVLSSDGKQYLFGGVSLFDVDPGDLSHIGGLLGSSEAAAFTPDSKAVVLAAGNQLSVYDSFTRAVIGKYTVSPPNLSVLRGRFAAGRILSGWRVD